MSYLGWFMVAVAVILAIAGLLQQSKAKKILAAPFKKTGEVASNPQVADPKGMISTEGAVSTQQPVNAPCSNQPCVYYELKVEKQIEESKMTDRGMQTTKTWKNVSEQKQGSIFYVNDGSGPVAVQAMDSIDADLKQVYSGAPPGGQGLGILANMLTGAIFNHGERIIQYRATEKIIPAQGNLFVMGKLAGGQITKTDGMMGKLMLSTKGREGLVGHTKKMAMIMFIVGGVLFVGGVPLGIFGGTPKDTSCKPTIENDLKEPCNASLKTEKPDTYTWKVTKAGVYEINVTQPSDATENMMANIVVRQGDWPLAIDFNPLAFVNGDAHTKVALDKGTYQIDISNYRANTHIEGGFRYILAIKRSGDLPKDGVTKAKTDDDEDDKGSAGDDDSKKKASDDDDDKGSAAPTTTSTGKKKGK
jgi:hypothetical protein